MVLPVFGKAHEARPGGPAPAFVWFIYGSSLDREAFAGWAREHGYALPDLGGGQPARLPGYRLAFDVVSRHWGGAVASLAEAAGEVVEGLAVPMPGSARGLVDHKEGALSGLTTAFPVTLLDAAGAALPAMAYRTAPGRRLAQDAAPSGAYLDVLVRGARAAGLSEGWLARLERLRAGVGQGAESAATISGRSAQALPRAK